MELVTGIDIGNAKTEIAFEENGQLKLVRQPSIIAYLARRPEANDLPLDLIMENLMDNLIVNISSPSIKKNGDYYIGRKAMESQGMKMNMKINLGGKATHDLPVITSLGMIAATAIKQKYDTEGELIESLSLDLKMATAIPSSEYSTQAAQILEERFKKSHIVTVYLGEQQVMVNIKVTSCKVTEEGKTAMIAFANSDKDILRNFNKKYGENKVPNDFLESRTLHTDIGDGTSEFVVIEGLNPIQGLSDGKRLGVGHASDTAIKILKDKMRGFDRFTRQQLQEWLKKDNDKGELAREAMDEAIYEQAQSILEEIQTSYQELASLEADYLFVHGGGSITFQDSLQEELEQYAEQGHFQVVWIPEEYATTMNSRGTYYLAKAAFGN